jgi:PAS domain S-box-containing protein
MALEREPPRTRLGDFLRGQQEELIATWTERVRQFSPAREISNLAIVDHLPEILARLTLAVSSNERVSLSDVPRAHAVDRLARGFDLREVVREYTILRQSILDLYESRVSATIDLHDVRRLHLAIDEAVEESATRFSSARERVLKALDRISEAALGTDDLDEFLQRLLEAMLETSDAVDSAVVLLRQGEWLRVRAAVGLATHLDGSAPVKVGDGFAGGVAARLRPEFVRDAGDGIRALYGVPLIHDGACIGVTHIGSATAYEFSEEDKLLFRTLASRATGVVVQTSLVHGLAQRELEFRALADNIVQLAWMADESGHVFWYNKRWFEYTGTTLDAMQDRSWQELCDSERGRHVVENFRHAIERGEYWEDTFPLRGKEGSYRWFLSHAVPIKDSSGRVIRWFGTHTDVTEQRETELELRAAEARLRLATEATQLGTWDLDLRNGEARWSSDMQRIFGIDFQPQVGWSLDVIHPDDREAVRAMLARSYDPHGDGRFALEYRVRVDPGREFRWVDSRGRTFFDERGHAIRMLGTTLDVTARKRAEVASKFLSDATAVLASSLDYSQTLAEVCRLAVPRVADWAAVTLLERDGRMKDVTVLHSDPSKTELMRRVRRQYPDRPDADAGVPAVIRSGQPELVREISDELLERMAPDAEQRRILRELGFKSYLVVPVVARERVLGAITFASAETARSFDDTDLETAQHLGRRAALAIDNARLYEEARQAMHVREQVLAVVSHDLRSPLSAIQLASSVLGSKLPETAGESAQRHVRTILRAADRMDHLIADLLDVASIQAGHLSVEPRSIAVGKLLDEAVANHEVAAGQKGIKLQREDSTPSIEIRVDPDRLLQVLANLIGNALKFCDDGDTISVRAALEGRAVVFSVRDSGPGIAGDELEHLFEPYWSAAARHARKGTGLGLYISRGIIDAHGGRIWAESTVGLGSTFVFTIPVTSDAQSA